jgi:hypothetical protein
MDPNATQLTDLSADGQPVTRVLTQVDLQTIERMLEVTVGIQKDNVSNAQTTVTLIERLKALLDPHSQTVNPTDDKARRKCLVCEVEVLSSNFARHKASCHNRLVANKRKRAREEIVSGPRGRQARAGNVAAQEQARDGSDDDGDADDDGSDAEFAPAVVRSPMRGNYGSRIVEALGVIVPVDLHHMIPVVDAADEAFKVIADMLQHLRQAPLSGGVVHVARMQSTGQNFLTSLFETWAAAASGTLETTRDAIDPGIWTGIRLDLRRYQEAAGREPPPKFKIALLLAWLQGSVSAFKTAVMNVVENRALAPGTVKNYIEYIYNSTQLLGMGFRNMKDSYSGITLDVHQHLSGADADHKRIAKEAKSQRPQPDTEDVESHAKSFKHPGITIGKWWTEMDGIVRQLRKLLDTFGAVEKALQIYHEDLGALTDMCAAVLITSGIPVRLGGWMYLRAKAVDEAVKSWTLGAAASSAQEKPPLIVAQHKHKTASLYGALRVLVLYDSVLRRYLKFIRPAVIASNRSREDDGMLFPWGSTGSTFKLHDTLRRGIKEFIHRGWILDDQVQEALEHDQGSDVCQTSFRKLVTDSDLTETQLTGLARMQGHHPETLKRYYQEVQRQKDDERNCIDLVTHLRGKAADSQLSQDADPGSDSDSEISWGYKPAAQTQLFAEAASSEESANEGSSISASMHRVTEESRGAGQTASTGGHRNRTEVLVDSPFLNAARRRFKWKHFEERYNRGNRCLATLLELTPRPRRVAVAQEALGELGVRPEVIDWVTEHRIRDYLKNHQKRFRRMR